VILGHEQFMWFVTAVITGTAIAWTIVDVTRMRRVLRSPPAAYPAGERRDRLFGSIIGLVIACVGVIGVLRHHLR
jgi:hypothetical protein